MIVDDNLQSFSAVENLVEAELL